MSITLSDGTVTIELHPDLKWTDENDWHPVEQSVDRSVTGALLIQAGAMVGGRPITLAPETESNAWMQRVDVEQLRNFAAVPLKQMTLTIRGVSRTVIFRHHDGGLESEPVVQYSDVVNTDPNLVTLRFMEV